MGGGAYDGGYFRVVKLIFGGNAPPDVFEVFGGFKYADKTGVSRTLAEVLRAGNEGLEVQGKGEGFDGMFKQEFSFVQKGVTPSGPSQTGHYYAVELKEVLDDPWAIEPKLR